MFISMLINILEVCRWHRKELNLNDAILCWGSRRSRHNIQEFGRGPGPIYIGLRVGHQLGAQKGNLGTAAEVRLVLLRRS